MDKNTLSDSHGEPSRAVWSVGGLCRAVADSLEARFNPVSVKGEISGFSRASSGHCYFSLKDASGQLRCAMFRRSASMLNFSPRDGVQVQVFGRLGVYEARGDLQLIVEAMRPAGQGALYEQFLQIKARLESQGLFAAECKRPVPAQPRRIAVVSSPNAAAWHDVMTALQRRVPHIPVCLLPAMVQGEGAAATLVQALQQAAALSPRPDVILLVRGGGSVEDLWAFNDESLAHCIAQSPVPIICGVGHETDFTIADFVADLRAPTPTAAAELCATAREVLLGQCADWRMRLQRSVLRQYERQAQRLDHLRTRLGRPQLALMKQAKRLDRCGLLLRAALKTRLTRAQQMQGRAKERLEHAATQALRLHQQRLAHLAVRLEALNPHKVLERGYALLTDAQGQVLTRSDRFIEGQSVTAKLSDGTVPLRVQART
jgi:exodeoxyribonuclease VII large subunit